MMISKDIANLIYDLFVVNNHAVGVQGENGLYYKKNIPVTPFIIYKMIENMGSMGCYQQCYHTDRLKWICFDFDCRDKDNPDVDGLYRECVAPLTEYLDSIGIRYLTEFSGRRGIHVWIVFENITTKFKAYHLMDTILENIPKLRGLDDSEKWSLDRFPKTDDASGNTVGSQVKFPLSSHRSGGRAYFFKGYYLPRSDVESEEFYIEQLSILNEYKPQDAKKLFRNPEIDYEAQKTSRITPYESVEEISSELEEIIACLEETRVYNNIFGRMRSGRAQQYDWLVLLGTFAPFDNDGKYLTSIFERYPNYDVEKTVRNVRKLKDRYYPAKFRYLYALYHLDMERTLNPDDTGVDYICSKLGGLPIAKEWETYRTTRLFESKLQDVLIKERNYLWDNDEVPSVSINNKLHLTKRWELNGYEEVIKRRIPIIPSYSRYIRHEEEKDRVLISLQPRDRIITTAVALNLYDSIGNSWESYSYQISVMNRDYIFYPWYSSWGRFISQIRVYMDLPFMSDAYVFYIDLKQCYQHVDMLNVFRMVESKLDEGGKGSFLYLADYNDALMRDIQRGNRKGVPQGPAYARILTEIYLDNTIKVICAGENTSDFRIFRYVDDIVVICDVESLSKRLYDKFIMEFTRRGMPVNTDKSHYYGKISDMSQKDKEMLLHTDNFNYDLSPDQENQFYDETDRHGNLDAYIRKHDFDIGLLGYIYGSRTFAVAQHYYFYNFGGDIMESRIGRGKSFRHFYEYLLDSSDRITYALKKGWFHAIPTDTVNFGNFIATLYYHIKGGKIFETDVRRIVIIYLDDLDMIGMSDEDASVTQAILEWIKAKNS